MATTSSAANPNGPAMPSSGAKSPRSYYGNLFDSAKKPSRVLEGLLRAIGQYIIDNCPDRSVKHLTAQKLGEFYKPFPSDIDKFLLEAPSKDLSTMWAVMGYEHYLIQPNHDRHARPSLPALTLEGFTRWQTVQLLVDPTENVPVLQYAVKNWKLRNPYTNEPFPPELPLACCPVEPDKKTVEWEDRCGEEIRKQAQQSRRPSYTGEASFGQSRPQPQAPPPPHPKVSPPTPEPVPRFGPDRRYTTAYAHHVPGSTSRTRSGTDPEAAYRTGAVPFNHVTSTSGGAYARRSPERDRERERPYGEPRPGNSARPRPTRDGSPEGSRRRSFNDYPGRGSHQAPYERHSASDPHLKSSQANGAARPPAGPTSPPATSAVPASGRPGGAPPYARRTSDPREDIQVESESDSETETDDTELSDEESPHGTRPARQRVHRPPRVSRPPHGPPEPGMPESINGKLYRERERVHPGPPPGPPPAGGQGPPLSPMPSPRLRPAAHSGAVGGRDDPRRRSHLNKIPFIGDIVSSVVNADRARRAHSHDSRYPPRAGGRRSYSDDPDYSSEEDYIDNRRRREDMKDRARYEAARQEQELRDRRYEKERMRDRDRERDRERDRDERSGRHLRRPEPTRRTSSHADADRLRGRDLQYETGRDFRDRDRRYPPGANAPRGRGPSPNQRRYAAPVDARDY